MSLNKSTPPVLQVSKLRTKKGRTEGISYSESFCHNYLQRPGSLNQKKKEKKQLRTHDKLISVNMLQFSSVAQSCLTLCDAMNHSTPGLPVHEYF